MDRMTNLVTFDAGNYRFIPGVFQYSAGVRAGDGFEIVCVRFSEPRPLAQAFPAVEAHLAAVNRPLAAFCSCELRSPAPFTEAGFTAFNREYVGWLQRWGVVRGGGESGAPRHACS